LDDARARARAVAGCRSSIARAKARASFMMHE